MNSTSSEALVIRSMLEQIRNEMQVRVSLNRPASVDGLQRRIDRINVALKERESS